MPMWNITINFMQIEIKANFSKISYFLTWFCMCSRRVKHLAQYWHLNRKKESTRNLMSSGQNKLSALICALHLPKWCLTTVWTKMIVQMLFSSKRLLTNGTTCGFDLFWKWNGFFHNWIQFNWHTKWFISRMSFHMPFKTSIVCKYIKTHIAYEHFDTFMNFTMRC